MFAGRRSQLAVSGQQLAVSNGRPTSHEPLATIFPPLLPNRGGPLDRFRRGRPVKASRYALRVSRSVVVSLSLSRRNAASESEPVMYGVYITFQAGRPLGRPLRCGHKAAKTSHEPLTTNNKKSTSGCPTSPAESRVSLSDRILSLHQVTRFGISDSHGFARRRAPSKPVPCLSQGTLVG